MKCLFGTINKNNLLLPYIVLVIVIIRVSVAVRRHCDDYSSYKVKYLIRVAHLEFRTSVYYHHFGDRHEDIEAYNVLVK